MKEKNKNTFMITLFGVIMLFGFHNIFFRLTGINWLSGMLAFIIAETFVIKLTKEMREEKKR